MENTRQSYSLGSTSEIRSVLRRQVFDGYSSQHLLEFGIENSRELCAYVNFMSEEECMNLLNEVREAPFIPGINMMWTQQVVDYLMLGDDRLIKRVQSDRFEPALRAEISFPTEYVKSRVNKRYWDMLPNGWSAKYYRPSQVLKIAIRLAYHRRILPFEKICSCIAEKVFIKAVDMEDCLHPVTPVPPVLPADPRPERRNRKKNEIVLRGFREGTRVTIDIPKAGQSVVPVVSERDENAKSAEAPRQGRNPVVTTVPAFSARPKQRVRDKKRSQEINELIMAKSRSFGGTDSAKEVAELAGLSRKAVEHRISKLRKQYGTPKFSERCVLSADVAPRSVGKGKYGRLPKEDSERLNEAIRTRSVMFGGNTSYSALAKEFCVSPSAVRVRAHRMHK